MAQTTMAQTERGLVVSPPFRVNADETITMEGHLDDQELRFALLFWDRLDYPDNLLFGVELSPDTQYLQGTGVLQRSTNMATSHRGDLADLYLGTHLGCFRALDEREPGRWSLARGERSLSFPERDLEPDRGFLFELTQAIPIPDRTVALPDILEFKAKRRDELLALRHHLEDIYQAVRAAPDRPLAETTALERLDLALSDHVKAINEVSFKLVLGGLQAKLDLKLGEGLYNAALAAAAGTMAGVTSALQIGGLAALYALGSSVSLKRRGASESPFEYVSLIHRRLY